MDDDKIRLLSGIVLLIVRLLGRSLLISDSIIMSFLQACILLFCNRDFFDLDSIF